MHIQVFRGLPFNKWVSWEEFAASGSKSNPFQNFRITKGSFSIQILTEATGELSIEIKLPNSITLSV